MCGLGRLLGSLPVIAGAASSMQTEISMGSSDSRKPYGSGYFGEWIKDEFDLPAYRYTCDQTNNPKARTPTNPIFRLPTDHTHQVGNDRLVAACSNYGYVQVRQDEGGPKFLNDFIPEDGQYGGGFGYLTDGRIIVSTYYHGDREACERIFGVGYYRKTVKAAPYTIDQVILAPFGDDPILVSQVTVTNNGNLSVDLRWIEYWGCQQYQFAFGPTIQAFLNKNACLAAEGRRALAKRFDQTFQLVDGCGGLLETKRLRDPSTTEKQVLGMKEAPSDKEPGFDDLSPAPTFLVSLDGPISGYGTDGVAFFGEGGLRHPDGIARGLDNSLSTVGRGGAFLLERSFHLNPGDRQTLRFAYGYLPEAVALDVLLRRYHEDLPSVWPNSSQAWKADGLRFAVENMP